MSDVGRNFEEDTRHVFFDRPSDVLVGERLVG